MRDPEKAIEAVFAGLRDAAAPPGIEQRVLKLLEESEEACGLSRFRWSWPQFLRPSAAVAGTFVCGAALAAIVFFFHTPSAHQRASRIPVPEKSITTAAAVLPLKRTQPLSVSVPIVRPKKEATPRRITLASADNSADAIAIRETQAPSRVAPPLPLTAQERLLLRMTHSYSHEELAVLDPVKWAAKDAEEKEAFEKFFGQVKIKLGEKE